MLKYLVGTFNDNDRTFVTPFIIVHAKSRSDACIRYNKHLNLVPPKARVMALVTLLGPFNMDDLCSHSKAVEALDNVSEEIQ
jgi:hypothetical protein